MHPAALLVTTVQMTGFLLWNRAVDEWVLVVAVLPGKVTNKPCCIVVFCRASVSPQKKHETAFYFTAPVVEVCVWLWPGFLMAVSSSTKLSFYLIAGRD